MQNQNRNSTDPANEKPRLIDLSGIDLPDRGHKDVQRQGLMEIDPDKFARVQKWAKQTHYAPEFIRKELPYFEKFQTLPTDKELDDLRKNAPATYELIKRADMAPVVADDYRNMGFFEKSFKQTLNSAYHEYLQHQKAKLLLAQRDADLKADRYVTGYDVQLRALDEKIKTIPQPEGGAWSNWAWHSAQFATQMLMAQPKAVTSAAAGAAVGAGVGSAVPGVGTATGATWGARTGYVAGLLKYTYETEGAFAYGGLRDLRDQNGNPLPVQTAVRASQAVGAINAVLESAGDLVFAKGVLKPVGKLGSRAVGKTIERVAGEKLAKMPVAQAIVQIMARNPEKFENMTLKKATLKAAKIWAEQPLTETATEYAQNVVQTSAEEVAKGSTAQPFERRTLGQIAAESAEGMGGVFVGSFILGSMGGTGTFWNLASDMREAERTTALLKELNEKGVKTLKLTERNADEQIAFLGAQTNGTPVENVYIPISAVERVAQENDMSAEEFLQQLAPQAAAQYPQAKATDGSIEINTALFGVRSAQLSQKTGKSIFDSLQDDLKADPEARTKNELREEVQHLKEQAQQADKLIEQGSIQQKELDQSYTDIKLIYDAAPVPANMPPEEWEENKENAARLFAKMAVVEAHKRKQDYYEYREQTLTPALRVLLDEAQTQAQAQAKEIYQNIKNTINQNDEILQEKQNGGKTPVLDYLIARGGVKTDETAWAGETENWRLKQSNIKGLINNKSGMDLGSAAYAVQDFLQQNGYGSLIPLGENDAYTPDVHDLIARVNEELGDYLPLNQRPQINKHINDILNVPAAQFKQRYEKQFGEKLPDTGSVALKNLHYFLLREAVLDGMQPSESVLAQYHINAEALRANNEVFGEQQQDEIVFQKDKQNVPLVSKEQIQSDLKILGYGNEIFFDNSTETPAEKDLEKINNYKKIIEGNASPTQTIELGITPQKLIESGVKQRMLRISYSVIKKAQGKKNIGHDLTNEMLKSIPEQLYKPIAVLDSRSHTKESIVVVTEIKDKAGSPVIVAIKMDYKGKNGNLINDIRSIHGRDNFEELFGLSLDEGKLLKIDINKAESLPQSYRAVLARGSVNSPIHRILDNKGNVKTQFIEIDGKPYATTNSEGNPLAPTIFGVHNFWKWFGNSKVVDENGKPLVVYHGTESIFDTFDMSKGRANMDIKGAFFSPWELDAQGYGRNIMPVYLSISNPADEATGYKALRKFQGQNNAGEKAKEYLKSLGYDGVINNNEEYIAFEPTQIKSVDNQGTFAPNTANIFLQKDLRATNEILGGQQQAQESFFQNPADIFKADEKVSKQVEKDIEDFVKGKLPREKVLSIGFPSVPLRAVGVANFELKLKQKTIKKDTKKKHFVKIETFKKLPSLLADPLLILKSDSETGSFVAVIKDTDKNGKRVIAAIDHNGKVEVNYIDSVYGKDNKHWFKTQALKGNLLYIDEQEALKEENHLYLRGVPYKTSNNRILTKEDIVKRYALLQKINYPINQNVLARLEEEIEPVKINVRFGDKEMQNISFEDVENAMVEFLQKQKEDLYATNDDTGFTALVSKSSKKKIFSSQRKAPKSIGGKIGKEIATHLGELFKRAILVKSHPDRQGKTEYTMHRFFVPAKVGKRYFAVKISVKEFSQKRKEFSFDAYDKNGERDFGIYDLTIPKELDPHKTAPVIERRGKTPSFHIGGQQSAVISANAQSAEPPSPSAFSNVANNAENYKPKLRELLKGVNDTSGTYNMDADGNVLFQKNVGQNHLDFTEIHNRVTGESIALLNHISGKEKQSITPIVLPINNLANNKNIISKKAVRKYVLHDKKQISISNKQGKKYILSTGSLDKMFSTTYANELKKELTDKKNIVANIAVIFPQMELIISHKDVNGSARTIERYATIVHTENADYFVMAVAKSGNVQNVAVNALYDLQSQSNKRAPTNIPTKIGHKGLTYNLGDLERFVKSKIVKYNKNFQTNLPAAHLSTAQNNFNQGNNNTLHRGSFNKRTNTITLTPHADASTLMHEMAHYFLNDRWNYLRSGQADQAYKKDFATLANFLDIKDGQENLTEKQHELFARSFEAYLREGKSPSLELSRLFARVRRWMLRVYRQNKDALGVTLDDDARRTFDAMLATQDEIDTAERERAFEPFTKQPGISEEEIERLRKMQQDAHNQAVATLMKDTMAELAYEQEQKRLYVEEKEHERVTQEMAQQPQYVLANVVETHFAQSEYARQNHKTATNLASAKEIAHAYHNNMLSEQDRALFNVLAESNGLTGPEMAENLVRTPDFNQTVNDEVTRRMEKYNLNKDMQALRRAATEALSGDNRLELLALERDLFINQKRAASRQRAMETRNLAKQEAKNWLHSKPAKKAAWFSPFYTGAKRAAQRAARALKNNDYEQAAKAKEEELFCTACAAESVKINKRLHRIVEYFKAVQRKKSTLFKKQEHFFQVADLLARLGFARADYDPTTMKTETLTQWAKRMTQNEDGSPRLDIVLLPDWLLNEKVNLDYRTLTIDQLQDVMDAVKNITHVANVENRLFTMYKNANIAELSFTIAQHLSKNIAQQVREKNDDQIEPKDDKIKQFIEGYFFSQVKFDTLLHKADGYHDFGLMHEIFLRPMKEAADKESLHLRRFFSAYNDLVSKHYSPEEIERMFKEKKFYPALGNEATKIRLIAMALNMGNSFNKQRLFENGIVGAKYQKDAFGAGKNNAWSKELVEQLLRENLTANDWDFVQGVWDLINEPWSAISEMCQKLTGFAPDKVQAEPFAIATSDGKIAHLRGGYYPIKYDWRSDQRAEKEQIEAEALYAGSPAVLATTKQGHTKRRAAKTDSQLSLDINLVERHMIEVLHDLYFRPLVIDMRRLLKNPILESTLKRNFGREGFNLFKNQLAAIADGGAYAGGISVLDKMFELMRRNTTIAVLAAKTSIIVENLANVWLFAGAIEGFTAKDTLAGIAFALTQYGVQSLAGTQAAKALQAFVFSKSALMKDKSENFDVTMRQLQKTNVFGKDSRALKIANGMIVATDDFFAIPMWITCYKKFTDQFIKEGKSPQETEQLAVERADMLINRVLGSGRRYDAAEFVRNKSKLARALNMFSTFMNNEFNRWMRETGALVKERDYERFAYFAANRLMWVTCSMLLAGKWPDDLTPDELLKWWLGGLVDNLSGMFLIARDFTPIVFAKMMGWPSFGYRPTPLAGALEDMLIRPVEAAGGYARGKKKGQDVLESTAKAASYALPYPQQFNTWFFNMSDYFTKGSTPRASDLYRRRPKRERGK